MKKAVCLVTGGAGFIGSHVAERLLAEKHKVVVLDDLSTGFRSNLSAMKGNLEFVKGSICREKDIAKAMKQVQYVFHLAANRAVLRSVDDPLASNEVNVTGTLKLLLAARAHKVKRFVFSSSSSIYGENPHFPLKESFTPDPLSPYAASKVMGEYYSRQFWHLYGLSTVSLRYFNVFGPRQNPESIYSAVIPIFVDAVLKNKSPEIHWDGKQSRDFSYVDNVVEGNLCAARAQGVDGEVFNIACHEEYSVLDILNGIKDILNKPAIQPIFKPKRAGDVRRTFADISKAKKRLGFKVQTRFYPGLKKTVEWFVKEVYKKS